MADPAPERAAGVDHRFVEPLVVWYQTGSTVAREGHGRALCGAPPGCGLAGARRRRGRGPGHRGLAARRGRGPGGPRTLEEIRRRFGDRVAGIVEGCTDSDTVPKPPWRERKERYVDHIRYAPAEGRLVSAADKLHNARAILADLHRHGDAVWQRFTADRAGVLWYYRSLVTAFRE